MTNWTPTKTNATGTCLQGYFETSYAALVKVLGEPNCPGDDYKVSTEWTLTDEAGRVVTVYDYKDTELYDDGLLSVKSFRELPNYDWHIGAKSKAAAAEFIAWLKANVPYESAND